MVDGLIASKAGCIMFLLTQTTFSDQMCTNTVKSTVNIFIPGEHVVVVDVQQFSVSLSHPHPALVHVGCQAAEVTH